MSEIEKKKYVDLILKTCLFYLVESKFIRSEDFNGKVIDTRFDLSHKLKELGFFAAASIDDIGRPVLIFNIENPLKSLAWAIAHEAIHIAQICKGDWEPCQGYSIWKGRRYENLTSDNPNYSSAEHQPWEAEAEKLEEDVRSAMYSKLPSLKSL